MEARDRNGLEVLDLEQCLELLRGQPVGRLAYVERGAPVVVPVNHVVAGSTIALLTSAGGKLDTAIMRRQVAFEVDDHDADTRTGWSVVVRGTADLVEDPDLLSWLEEQELQPWADPAAATWMSIRADEVSGRRIRGVARGAAGADAPGAGAYAPGASNGGQQ